MILYLDSSAAVKRYVDEPGSTLVSDSIAEALAVGIVTVGRAEIAAAFSRAARLKVLSKSGAEACLQAFRSDWSDYVRVQATEALTGRAEELAWRHGLRGYDSIHLAAAELWQEGLGSAVAMVTFDRQLWAVAQKRGFATIPASEP